MFLFKDITLKEKLWSTYLKLLCSAFIDIF